MAGILNIQLKPKIGDKDNNIKRVEHFLKINSDKKLDLVVLPEFFSTGVNTKAFNEQFEDEFGGNTIKKISEFAQLYKTNIVAGSVVTKVDDKLYNTTFVVNRQGEIVGKYNKIHLYNVMGGKEDQTFSPGNEIVTVDLDFAKIGIASCFDLRYPLQFKDLAKQGAEIMVLPAAWIVPTELYTDEEALKFAQDTWLAMNKVRAFDNLVYMVASNQTKDINGRVSAIGNSVIVAPTSQILANAKNEQCAIYADIDVEIVKYYKAIYPIANID